LIISINKKICLISSICVLLLIFVLVIFNNFGSKVLETFSQTSNWGLSFQEAGKTPVGNVSSEFLKKYNAYYTVSDEKKVIYLTFDAGFENGNTAKILDVLKKHNIKSSFFLVGNYLETEPELVRRMVNEGHIVGNHTYTHPDMSKITNVDEFKKELSKFEEKYKEVTNKELIKFYRPPQGKFSEDNLKQANELGYKTFFWSLAYVDWYVNDQPAKEQAFKKLIPRIHPGAIVLLHSTSKTNADILDELILKWKELGYAFKNLDEIK
jgi:peptidoglycan-N-acetylmuramic acid deacetylase